MWKKSQSCYERGARIRPAWVVPIGLDRFGLEVSKDADDVGVWNLPGALECLALLSLPSGPGQAEPGPQKNLYLLCGKQFLTKSKTNNTNKINTLSNHQLHQSLKTYQKYHNVITMVQIKYNDFRNCLMLFWGGSLRS